MQYTTRTVSENSRIPGMWDELCINKDKRWLRLASFRRHHFAGLALLRKGERMYVETECRSSIKGVEGLDKEQ